MSNQLQITGGGKVRNLEGVITGTSGVLSSVPLGAANGVATLDSGGKVPVSQLPSSVVTYLGTWNAATNTPTLVNGTGDAGDMYICNVAGTVNFGAGPIPFAVGDWVLYGSGTWEKSNGQNGTVTSVAASITGNAVGLTGSPITTAGTLAFAFAGTNLQYVNGAGNLTTFPILTGYVPYTGATGDVNLGLYSLTSNAIKVIGDNSTYGGTLSIKQSNVTNLIGVGYTELFGKTNRLGISFGAGSIAYLSNSTLTAERTYTLPDASGTIALTSDIPSLAGYVTLGTTQTITGAKTFSAYTTFTSTVDITSGLTFSNSGFTLVLQPPTLSVNRTVTFPNATGTLALTSDLTGGTVTSVASLTIGTTGTDLSSSVANSTTTPVITLNVPTASATNRGALSSADWTTFNNKQSALTNPVTGTGTTNYLPKFTSASTIGNSIVQDNGSKITIGGNLQVEYPANGNIAYFRRSGGSYNFALAITGSEVTNTIGFDADWGTATKPDMIWSMGTAEKMRLTASGNLGLGVTPSAWYSTMKSITVKGSNGNGSSWYSGGSQDLVFFANGYYDAAATPTRNGAGGTAQYRMNDAQHSWWTDAITTGAISLTQAMTLNASGNLGLGSSATSPVSKLSIGGNGYAGRAITAYANNADYAITFQQDNGSGGGLQMFSTAATWGADPIRISDGTSTQLNLKSNGNLLVGTTSDSGYKLDVNGTGRFSGNVVLSGSDSRFNGGDSVGRLILSNSNTTTYIGLYGATHPTIPYVMSFVVNSTAALTIASTGAATFSANIIANGTSAFYAMKAVGSSTSGASYGLVVLAGTTSADYAVRVRNQADNADFFTILGTGAATFSSTVTATGFFESSDSRLKTLIQDNYQTKGIASITPKLYTKNGKVELGYYAQDFVGVLDSAVSKGSDDMLSLSYREVLVAKVYALEQRIKELENN